jgi:hypothetical protein
MKEFFLARKLITAFASPLFGRSLAYPISTIPDINDDPFSPFMLIMVVSFVVGDPVVAHARH